MKRLIRSLVALPALLLASQAHCESPAEIQSPVLGTRAPSAPETTAAPVIRDCRQTVRTYGFRVNCQGSRIMITTQTNPTTGYDWHFRNFNREKLRILGSSYKRLHPRAKGSPSVATYSAEILSLDQSSFDFWYMRNWKGGGIDNGYRFVLTADSSMNISGFTVTPLKRQEWKEDETGEKVRGDP